ncbi:MAG: acyl-CoA dehydrogenase family protein [Clostridia bacterium]|jgi:alkylation response protein AidB-like acyl-CoA dehydrogenase|nr:acyl-CoA/acyl-ACP dehydrogenase [Clostridia bacterium]MDH7573103.1 acyl-CoA dehydrogenase family protein [Clostridia bacterium]
MEAFPWWSEEHRRLKQEVKHVVDELVTRAEEAWWKREFPWDVVRVLAERGYFGAGIAKEYGGMGLGVTGTAIVGEEVFRLPGAGMGAFGASMLGGVHQIEKFGTEEQKKRFLRRVAAGELGAVAATEPFAGTDVAGMETVARRDGNYYVITGKKRFVTGAGVASRYMLYARTSDDPDDIRGYRHLTGFIVEKGMDGFRVERINELIGLDNTYNGSLHLEEVRVPAANRIGEEGQGWQLMVTGFNYERALCAVQAACCIRECLRTVVPYARRRIQFGRPTLELPANQMKIAEMLGKLRLARLSAFYAAYLLDLGWEAAVECSVSKLATTEMLTQVALEAVQVMGGDGVTKFYPLERLLREAKIHEIAGGTSEAMKLLIFRLGLKEMADELIMKHRCRDERLRVPLPAAAMPPGPGRVDGPAVLQVLAEDYAVNPGLYVPVEDLRARLGVAEEQRGELEAVLAGLEEEKLVKLFRKGNRVELVKATYEGLRKTYPLEYYRYIPAWAQEENLF